MHQDPQVIVALDFDNKTKALNLVDQLDPTECRLKVGKEMFTHFGPAFVKELISKKFDVFLDLKFHDIPNTVAKACMAAADMGVWMVNVHASGGSEMMARVSQSLDCYGKDKPKLIAVTVLTSMSDQNLVELGINSTAQEHVLRLATITQSSGFDGVVCSAQEASMLKSSLGTEFKLVTPGIRPMGSAKDDQQRIMTPEKAIIAGVDYIVIGRPITQSDNPLKSLSEINNEIERAVRSK